MKEDTYHSEENKSLKKVIGACFIGNFIEWFDYASYGYLVSVIAVIFFPQTDHVTGLIAAFSVFALSFFIRPLGGIFWGWFGDRTGRKKALSYSIIIMSLATTLIAFMPTYESVGIVSPLLLILARMAQGFSASGEYAGGAIFLAEHAPNNKRGLYTSLIPASTASGLLFGSLFVAGLYAILNNDELHSWGWRIPFLIAAPSGLIGYYIRVKLNDSPVFRQQSLKSRRHKKKGFFQLIKEQKTKIIIGGGMTCLNAVAFYLLLSYLPTYFITYLEVPEKYSFFISSIMLLLYILMVVLMGWLSDYSGRKVILYTASLFFIFFSIPMFVLLNNHSGNLYIIAFIYCFSCIFLAMNDGNLACFLCEIFPTSFRYTGFAFSFNCANTLFGGTAPLVSTWLIQSFNSNIAPAFLLTFAALVTFLSMFLSKKISYNKLYEEVD